MIKEELFFKKCWKTYLQMNRSAQKVYNLLKKEGETLENDHIAFRTWNNSNCNLEFFKKKLEKIDYKEAFPINKRYNFVSKKLKATYFLGPSKNSPKIFVSELLLENFDNKFRDIFTKMNLNLNEFDLDKMAEGYRPWPIDYQSYLYLEKESEYASWIYAHGICVNHFTISVNSLKKYNNLNILNKFLKENNFLLNNSGPEIKGSEEDLLLQSSTMADSITKKFSDGNFVIPTSYLEFAKRLPYPSGIHQGELFQGFIPESADKIFESTIRLKN